MKVPTQDAFEIGADLRRTATRLLILAARVDPTIAPFAPESVTPGARLIATERARQIAEEGFDREHDAEFHGNELAWAAFCYLERAAQDNLPQGDRAVPHVWPLTRSRWRPKDTRLRNLTIAAALVAAEIDRLWDSGERE